MPQAQNLTVKDSANVDKTFTLINPAAGDGGMAEWALKVGAIATVFPRLTAVARKSNRSKVDGTGRVLSLKFRMPSSHVDPASSLTIVGPACEANITVSIPDDFPESAKADFPVFVKNLLALPDVQAAIKDALGFV